MPQLLHDLFERTAHRHPARIAVEFPANSERAPSQLSYADLCQMANHIRGCLGHRVERECIVAILLPKESPFVHAAQLAILQSGAAFLCVDLAFPDEHIRSVLVDASPVAILTDSTTSSRVQQLEITQDLIVSVSSNPKPEKQASLRAPDWLTPRSLAYVIYTSGTTGRPKGVMIEHHSIVHLLTADQDHFNLHAGDRCMQVSSNSYDNSIEECWLPFTAGATVVVADDQVTRLGPDLVPWLREQCITVLMPTPTMLLATGCSDPARELADLRLIYIGGEALPQDLADRWAKGRRLENGYGPTECTVTVTRAHVQPGASVTIGKPIGKSCAHVLNEALEEVDEGELCISGPCLARGYLRRPGLTAERFPHHVGFGRMYRTGDLVDRDKRGDLRYLGRIDSQVKVRGYRIELAAIEAQLTELPGVGAAACKVQGEIGRELIVAYVVPQKGEAEPDTRDLARRLRAQVAEYMVPDRFAVVEQLPTLVSGKLDRRALPDIDADTTARSPGRAPESESEHLIAKTFAATLGIEALSVDEDFFDLGGNSVRAAELISHLRAHASCIALTVRDVYECRTVAVLAKRAESTDSLEQVILPPHREAKGHPVLVTFAQVAWLLAMLVGGSAVVYVALYLLLPWLVELVGLVPLILLSPFLTFVTLVVYTSLAVIATATLKRVLIGKYTACRAPAWGGLFLRNWIVQRCVRLVPWSMLQGTVFFNAALRALGATVGERVHIHRGVDLLSGGWDLLTLGDDVTLSQDAALGLVEYDDGDIVFGTITLGPGSTLDIRAGMEADSSLGAGACLTALSNLSTGTHVPNGASWDGVPAGPAGVSVEPESAGDDTLSPVAHGILLIAARWAVGTLFATPFALAVIAVLVVYDVNAGQALEWFYAPGSNPTLFALATLFGALSLIVQLALTALALRWTRSVAEGRYSRWSSEYIRIWLRTGLVESAGRWLSGSLYWRWWLRLAGMRLGRNCEISTIIDVLPEQVSIGDETFFADGIYLAGPRIHRGVVTVEQTSLSHDSFLGNHAVVHAGAHLPPHVLIGVSTVADDNQIGEGTSWFGHPPIELPQREIVECDRRLTHDPSVLLYAHRLLWETLRFGLPAVTMLAFLCWINFVTAFGVWWMPLVTLAVGVGLALTVLGAKWLLLGRVQPGTHGLWSAWCCRWDFLYMAWGMLANGPLSPLAGTLLLPWYLRAMGMRIGRRVVLAGSFAQVVDPDMLTLDDGATVDPMFQAHTFEDRVLKIGPVHVGRNATVRRGTVLLYGTKLGTRSSVAPHSVVMKNESLSAGRRYAGCPTRPI